MTNDLLIEEFIQVMNECGFDIEKTTLDEELQYDSYQFVSTMVSLEDTFDITIPDQFLSAQGLDTARDMLNMVQMLIDLK